MRQKGNGKREKYLLLEWQDGWREVAKIEESVEGLIRYYVIRRVTEKGRLAFEKPDYPELILIDRKPTTLCRLAIYDDNRKTYSLTLKDSRKIGDKVELLYEKVESEGFFEELIENMKTILEREGVTAKYILSLNEGKRYSLLEEIRKKLHIYPSKNNKECLDFLESILKEIAH